MHSGWKIMLRLWSEQEGGSHYSAWWTVIVDLTVAGWRFLPNAKPPPLHAAATFLNLLTNHLDYIVLSTVHCWLKSVICNRTTTSPLNIALDISCCSDKVDFYKKFSDISTSPLPMRSSRSAFLLRITVYKLFSQLNIEDYVYYSKEGQANSKNKCSKHTYRIMWERSQTEKQLK